MTEAQLKSLIALQKHLSEAFEAEAPIVKSEEFKELDGLNKDLLITHLNSIQSLLGIISIRIGLNISALQVQRQDATEDTKEGTEPTTSPENEEATTESTGETQPVA